MRSEIATKYCFPQLLEHGTPDYIHAKQVFTDTTPAVTAYCNLDQTPVHMVEKEIANHNIPTFSWVPQQSIDSLDRGLLKFVAPEHNSKDAVQYYYANKSEIVFLLGYYYGQKQPNRAEERTIPNRTDWYVLDFDSNLFDASTQKYLHGMMEHE